MGRTYVDNNRVESNDIHRMLIVTIDDIAAQSRVPDLQTRAIYFTWVNLSPSKAFKHILTQKERNLPRNPMPLPLYTQSPNNQPNTTQHRSRISQPKPHLWQSDPIIPFQEPYHKPVAQTTREEDLGEYGAEDEAEEEEALDLELVGCVGGGFHC
jgi:hypothetical protein